MKCEKCNSDMVWKGSLQGGRMHCYGCEADKEIMGFDPASTDEKDYMAAQQAHIYKEAVDAIYKAVGGGGGGGIGNPGNCGSAQPAAGGGGGAIGNIVIDPKCNPSPYDKCNYCGSALINCKCDHHFMDFDPIGVHAGDADKPQTQRLREICSTCQGQGCHKAGQGKHWYVVPCPDCQGRGRC